MDRRLCTIFLLLLLSIPLVAFNVSAAPTVSDEKIGDIYKNLDSLFTLSIFQSEFRDPSKIVYTPLGNSAALDYQTQHGQVLTNLYSNAEPGEYYSFSLETPAGASDNFYAAIDISAHDVYPLGKGGCAVKYTALSTAADAVPQNVFFYLGEHADARVETGDDETNIELSSDEGSSRIGTTSRLEIVRLLGYTFFYLDKAYVGQTYDEIKDPVSVSFGPVLFDGGEFVSCSFDNFEYRRMNQ